MYYSFSFPNLTTSQRELLIAYLSGAGFEGFEEDDDSLIAFIKATDFDHQRFGEIVNEVNIGFEKKEIPATNWNAAWESNFQPVTVEDDAGKKLVYIRAAFHPAESNALHEILITPKMSFGTGHHATTYMVAAMMYETNFTGKTIIDFGTGTGILAILAAKLGAAEIYAIDNDDWSIENAKENISNNHCSNIHLSKAENLDQLPAANIIIANINLNIIIDNLESIIRHGRAGTIILLSGILDSDKAQISKELMAAGLTIETLKTREKWMAIKAVI